MQRLITLMRGIATPDQDELIHGLKRQIPGDHTGDLLAIYNIACTATGWGMYIIIKLIHTLNFEVLQELDKIMQRLDELEEK